MMSQLDHLAVIAPSGDLILDVRHENGGEQFAYRVCSKVLQENSRYFKNLLSERFSEGRRVLEALEARKLSGNSKIADVPADALPRIPIVGVGRISISNASNIQNLIADFLRAVHGLDLAVPNPPVPNLANLAVVADRFDALHCLSRYVRRKKFLHLIDAKSKGRSKTALPEERMRQKLLIGLLFDHPPWATGYSKYLIMRDSVQWRPGVEEDHTKALWWDIPNGAEDELIRRRECILETINSLQSHFLKLYTSGERQCKLGYDTSIQCDSFQLGEMVRFFTKLNTLRLQGTIYDNTDPTYYSGDIDRLLESLRQCSSYQIDRNHAHCGLRVRLIPLLDLIWNQLSSDTGSLDIGICAECWNHHRPEYAWTSAKRPVLWNPKSPSTGSRSLTSSYAERHEKTSRSCLNRHVVARDMFMAVERDWTG